MAMSQRSPRVGSKDDDGDDDDIEDKFWDELPPPLQTAASKLGYTQKLWDDDQEPAQADRNWVELTQEQQDAARLLGYTQTKWDDDVYSACSSSSVSIPDDKCDPDEGGTATGQAQGKLENEIKLLRDEITQRQSKLKKLLRKREGSAYAHMLMRNENHVNTQLENSLTDFHPDSLKQSGRFLPGLEHRGSLQLIRDAVLNEYYHTLPGCISMSLHCVLYITIYGVISYLTKEACNQIGIWLTGWHIINHNYDFSMEEYMFYTVMILFSFFLARITGVLYDWNENRSYQRRVQFHIRNRWYLGCWDIRIMNWFSGDGISDMHSRAGPKPDGVHHNSKEKRTRKWGPRLKYVLDICSFFLCYCCMDRFINEAGMNKALNTREAVLEGLPSRQLKLKQQHLLSRHVHNEHAMDQVCISNSSDIDDAIGECSGDIAVLQKEFTSDILNWVLNSNRCGWVSDEDEEDSEDEDKKDSGYDEENDDTCDNCSQKQDDTKSSMIAISNVIGNPRTPKTFKPWKQHAGDKEEWKHVINLQDDEYLRANISMEAYYSLVGDPHATFIDPVMEQYYFVTLTVFSFACLYWLRVPFLLI